jgi:hypothetical protein
VDMPPAAAVPHCGELRLQRGEILRLSVEELATSRRLLMELPEMRHEMSSTEEAGRPDMEAPPSPQTKDEEAPLYVKAKTKAAEAKAESEAATAPPAPAEAPALTEAPAGGALVAAETEPEAKPETKTEESSETDATEPQTKAKAGDAEDNLDSNKASLVAASMLAQICERAFMEHQLAARHFTFYSFCAHAPALSVCLMCACTCPYRPDCAVTAPLCRGILRPAQHFDRRHLHLGVRRRRV